MSQSVERGYNYLQVAHAIICSLLIYAAALIVALLISILNLNNEQPTRFALLSAAVLCYVATEVFWIRRPTKRHGEIAAPSEKRAAVLAWFSICAAIAISLAALVIAGRLDTCRCVERNFSVC
jgi:uncharacterized membrane protein